MSRAEEVTRAYCPGCNHPVKLTLTPAHPEGQASLPDGHSMVCLDFGEGCAEGRCPLTGSPGIVMGVRLARSHLNDGAFDRLTAPCDACGNVGELEVLGDGYAFCGICESTVKLVLLDLDEGTRIAITGR